MDRRIASALAAGLILQSTVVFADASATASFSNIAFELIDLDPGDGIAPSVTFNGVSSVQAFTDFTATNQTVQVLSSGATSFGPVSATSPASPNNGASASFVGDVYAGTGTATASAWARGIEAPFNALSLGAGETIFGDNGAPTTTGFVLSPHTELIISGLADLEGETTPGGYGQQTDSSIYMYINADTSAGPQHSEASLDAALDGTSPSGSVTREESLSVSFFNGDATTASGSFVGRLDASAVSFVPELPTAMMLLAVLAAVVFGAVQCKRTWRDASVAAAGKN